MSFVLFFFGYVVFVAVLKITLQFHWARQLHARHGARYSRNCILSKIGRSHYYRFVLQPREALDPAFLADLKRAQHRSFVWDLALGAFVLVAFLTWLILKRLGF